METANCVETIIIISSKLWKLIGGKADILARSEGSGTVNIPYEKNEKLSSPIRVFIIA